MLAAKVPSLGPGLAEGLDLVCPAPGARLLTVLPACLLHPQDARALLRLLLAIGGACPAAAGRAKALGTLYVRLLQMLTVC